MTTPQAQEQQRIIEEVAQFVAAKWAKPAVVILYGGPGSAELIAVPVTINKQGPTEAQLMLAGTELLERAAWMRRVRFTVQMGQPGG